MNGKYQPQLRSKTPTTDRLLFQHTLGSNSTNDYIFLNENGVQPQNNNNNNNNFNELYSTVNQNKKPDANSKVVHVPIYDSTTNIQHQRVQQNLNKFNHSHQSANGVSHRSKTPGPDVIYFHNNNNNNTSSDTMPSAAYQTNYNGNATSLNKAATVSAATAQSQYGVSQFNYMSRSKTPTADIMYYPSSKSQEYSNKQQHHGGGHHPTKRANTRHLFDNIYQPFNQPDDRDLQDDDHYMDNNNFTMALGHQANNHLMKQSLTSDVDGNCYAEMVIDLYRQETGFGFRIVGGEEEGSQVAVGYIVNNGAAHVDGRLRPSDEIVMIDNECVLGATHRRVVQLMTIAGLNRKVKLRIRRKLSSQQYNKLLAKQQQQPQHYPNNTITLFRKGNEGFGFVIISTINKAGPSIGTFTNIKNVTVLL